MHINLCTASEPDTIQFWYEDNFFVYSKKSEPFVITNTACD